LFLSFYIKKCQMVGRLCPLLVYKPGKNRVSALRPEPERFQGEMMRRKNRNSRTTEKVITAAVVGSLIGATIGLLMAPASGEEMRRRMRSGAAGAREKLKSAVGDVETQARELAQDVHDDVAHAKQTASRRKKEASAAS
jgi:gas vesicle protein